MSPKAHIGCSGFLYKHWRGLFYPKTLPQTQWFAFYQKHFDTVEMNVTFYRTPKKGQFQRWYETTPEGFIFSVNGSRFITHIKRLAIDTTVQNNLQLGGTGAVPKKHQFRTPLKINSFMLPYF